MDWFPALSATGALAFVTWMARSLIATRLTESVKSEFAGKLEDLRAEQRRQEQASAARIEAYRVELDALRRGALHEGSERRLLLHRKKTEAVGSLWESVVALEQARGLLNNLLVLNIDEVAKEVRSNDKMRRFVDQIAGTFPPEKLDGKSASIARPFVGPAVWARYIALSSVVGHAVLLVNVLRMGDDPSKFVEERRLKELIVKVLPHKQAFVDEHGFRAAYLLFDSLIEELLVAVDALLDGKADDEASVARAKEILRISAELSSRSEPRV
jgi:hypothetical protein